jgi:hypothetical protein
LIPPDLEPGAPRFVHDFRREGWERDNPHRVRLARSGPSFPPFRKTGERIGDQLDASVNISKWGLADREPRVMKC